MTTPDPSKLDAFLEAYDSGRYQAWANTGNVRATLTRWEDITLQANNTADRYGPDRRERAAQISALKRAIERATGYRLEVLAKRYSETHGFLHQTSIRYTIHRPASAP